MQTIVTDLKGQLGDLLANWIKENAYTKLAVITDKNVEKLYGIELINSLKKNGVLVTSVVVPPGEKSKTRRTKEMVEDRLLEERLDRKCLIIGLGGGVVTDLAGFVAATYLRGVDLLFLPTTLMGMVDAAIGGKTGVNTPLGKNVIGAFYPAKEVWIVPGFLQSLSKKGIEEGIMEICKYGLIWDKELFYDLASGRSPSELIERSIAIKQAVVEKDPKEEGIRKILNFGHTIAHAIECFSNYQISHGEALSIGLLAESFGSMQLGFFKESEYVMVRSYLQKRLIKAQLDGLDAQALFALMKRDKKSTHDSVKMVVLEEIGRVASFSGDYVFDVSFRQVTQMINSVKEVATYEISH